MANKTVTITVLNADGDMAYSASVLHASVGDIIKWAPGNNTGAFTLTFNPSPFAGGQTVQSGSDGTASATVKSGASGRYYYSVSATYTPNGTTYDDPGCPELIIR